WRIGGNVAWVVTRAAKTTNTVLAPLDRGINSAEMNPAREQFSLNCAASKKHLLAVHEQSLPHPRSGWKQHRPPRKTRTTMKATRQDLNKTPGSLKSAVRIERLFLLLVAVNSLQGELSLTAQ